jgi:hypothetical protein
MHVGKTSPVPAFIHIPKTGGTFIGQLESGGIPVLRPMEYLGHCYMIDHPDEINPLYPGQLLGRKTAFLFKEKNKQVLFSNIRNPFDFLVSYAGHAGGWNPRYRATSHYDYENIARGFDYLVKTIANRDNHLWPNRKFLYFQLFTSGGSLAVDWLNRVETMHEDLTAFAKETGAVYTPRPKQRVGIRGDYRTYYTDSLIELVEQTWGRELKLYGYSFDGVNLDQAVVKRKIELDTKTKVRYDLKRDLLTIGGQTVR